jgi:hypothetical protein
MRLYQNCRVRTIGRMFFLGILMLLCIFHPEGNVPFFSMSPTNVASE